MTKDEIFQLYRDTGALREGHFLLSSGRHTDQFFQSAAVLQHPDAARRFGAAIAADWRDAGADFVIGPALGGIVLAFVTALELGVPALFAEKSTDPAVMVIRKGLSLQPGQRFLAVEDVVTTGGSVLKAIRAAEAKGAVCVGLGAIVDRNDGETEIPYPYRPLAGIRVASFEPDACPLCAEGLPLVKI